MHIASLKAQAKIEPKAAKIKETMILISLLGIGASDVLELLETKIFPVRLPNGQSCFATASSKSSSLEFAIIDNLVHQNAFQGKLPFLEFSLEDIRDTRPFLFACGLENRLTSSLADEVTDVQGGLPNVEMTRMLRSKAPALVRYVNQPAF